MRAAGVPHCRQTGRDHRCVASPHRWRADHPTIGSRPAADPWVSAYAHRVVELAPELLGSPRDRRTAHQPRGPPRLRPAVALQGLGPGVVLEKDPAAHASLRRCRGRRARRIASASSTSGATVAPPPHGARTTKPPTAPSSASRTRAAVGRRSAAMTTAAVLAGRDPVQAAIAVEIGRPGTPGWARSAAHGVRPETRRLECPVPGLDLEPEELVERPAPIRGHEDERPRTRPRRRRR